ncbi:hypothetical protein GCM10020227_50220 [Streptomyces flavovirens]
MGLRPGFAHFRPQGPGRAPGSPAITVRVYAPAGGRKYLFPGTAVELVVFHPSQPSAATSPP